MPYMKVHEGGKVKVFKKGPDGKPEGEAIGTNDSDEAADNQIAAIHAEEDKKHGPMHEQMHGKRDVLDDLEVGFKVLPDGTWKAIWTNSFQDYQGEWIASKALDDYIARVQSGFRPYPELWFWHLPVPIGQTMWVGRVGHFALAAGKFLDSVEGRAFKDFLEKKGQGYKNSHGFNYPVSQKRDGVFHAIDTFEITFLPPHRAANPLTMMGVRKAMADITAEQRKFLDEILGADEAAKFIQKAADASKKLDELGVEHKEKQDAGATPTDAKPDPETVKQIADLGAKLEAAEKAAADKNKETLEAVKALLVPIGQSVDAAQKQVAEARKENEALRKFIAEQFEQQPRASKSKQTLADKDDPELVKIEKQQAEEALSHSAFAPFFQAIKQMSGGMNG